MGLNTHSLANVSQSPSASHSVKRAIIEPLQRHACHHMMRTFERSSDRHDDHPICTWSLELSENCIGWRDVNFSCLKPWCPLMWYLFLLMAGPLEANGSVEICCVRGRVLSWYRHESYGAWSFWTFSNAKLWIKVWSLFCLYLSFRKNTQWQSSTTYKRHSSPFGSSR